MTANAFTRCWARPPAGQQSGVHSSAAAAAIGRLLDASVCRSAVHVLETASTNTLALEDLAGGVVANETLPRLYVAEAQSAGRGRRGRSWLSADGSLTFSLLVESIDDVDGAGELLSLAAGVGVARAIEYDFAPLQPRLKWPNDVYLGGGKVAGILCEANQAASGRLVVGIGLNVAAAPDLSNEAGAARAASIAETVGRTVEQHSCLEGLVTQVLQALRLAEHDQAELIAAFRSRCLLSGCDVACTVDGQPVRGRCLGVNDRGHLAVQTDRGVVSCRSGEAALVRRTG